MLLWLLMNVALPLLPIALIGLLIWLLEWKTALLDVLGDGQLYFFSITIWGVFSFDALNANQLQPLVLAIALFATISLMCFYTVSVVVTHSGVTKETQGFTRRASRKLTLVSFLFVTFSIVSVFYLRLEVGLL